MKNQIKKMIIGVEYLSKRHIVADKPLFSCLRCSILSNNLDKKVTFYVNPSGA